MTWTEGVLRISDTFAIHGGYLGIIVSIIFAIAIILFLLFVGAVGYMIGDTINEVYKDYKKDKDLAAKALGISRATLYRKLDKYNIISK